MNKCTDSNIREMLPDLLHGTLAAGCAGACGGTSRHVRGVQGGRSRSSAQLRAAAVFAPVIDVDRVVRQIPPYRTIVPADRASGEHAHCVVACRREPGRRRDWRVDRLCLYVRMVRRVARGCLDIEAGRVKAGGVDRSHRPSPGRCDGRNCGCAAAPRPHALALAANVDDLSDGNLVQLMDDMSRFDALPASEPDPVIAVDSGL